MDNTSFINASIDEVKATFIESLILVVLVVFLFLQKWRTTLIPVLAVPVSIIGTFASFVLLDFSINTLTLFAMVLAIGMVVDDAIVVIENVEEHMERRNSIQRLRRKRLWMKYRADCRNDGSPGIHLHSGCLPWRHHGRPLQAVCRDDYDIDCNFRICCTDADACPLRASPEAGRYRFQAWPACRILP